MQDPQDAGAGRVVHIAAQDGLILAARLWGARRANLPPVLCLAGLSRNSRDFERLGQTLALEDKTPRLVVALDARGRGLSGYDRDWRNYAPLTEARDVLTAATALGIAKAVIVGTSRGGILAMIIGALRPALLAGVVLNDIGPVIEGAGLARIKAYLAAARSVADWDDARTAIRARLGSQFRGLSDDDWRALATSSFREQDGVIRPDHDPNLTKGVEALDLGAAVPVLWPQFASLRRVPVLAIRGELSDVLAKKTVARMAERHPRFEHATVAGQGHPPLLRDAPTLALIRTFIARCEAGQAF